jgi:hypothetical protein
MKTKPRTAALAFGLALAASCSLGSSTARAQATYPTVPARAYYSYPRQTYAPAAPRYVVPRSYYRTTGQVWTAPNRGWTGYNRGYNYSPARRGLKLYKPWLSR